MRQTSFLIVCLALSGILFAGCEMPPEKGPEAGKRTFRQGEYLPKLDRWDAESKMVNRTWYEVLIDVRGFEKKQLAGFYQRRRTFKPLKRKRGDRDIKQQALYTHHIYPVSLEYEIGFYTNLGSIYKYIWNDREKKTVYVAKADHRDAIKVLLGIPQDQPIILKPASRDEEFIWHEGKFMRK
jgi:hypothetical protein